jgi:hypothetical protein
MVDGGAMAAVPSPVRMPPKSIVPQPTWLATLPRTSWPPASPTNAKFSWPTQSVSQIPSAFAWIPSAAAKIDEARIEQLVRDHFPLTPKGIIEHLKLRRPIFLKTAEGGHFGRTGPTFTWEATDKVKALKKAAK